MIAPRPRLLVLAAVVVAPLAALAGLVPALSAVCVAAIAAIFAAAVWDAGRGFRAIDTLAVRLPTLLRATKDVEARLPVEVINSGRTAVPVQVALRLPDDLVSERMIETVTAGPGVTRVAWPFVPRERGDYRIEVADIERGSPWELWSLRTVVPVECEVRAYPNMRGGATRALLLSRETSGTRRQRQVGRGREFEKLRDYARGDSFDEIYWKATARRGKPIVKVFQLERTQELYVVVDASRLSARRETLEKYVTAALHLGLAAERQGDRFGLVTFSDKVHQFVRARSGKAHYRACREAIYKLQPRRVSPDFGELFGFIQTVLRRRALLVVLTALDDPVLAESFAQAVGIASRRHLVLVNVAGTPGIQPLFEGPPPEALDDLYRGVAGQLFWKKLRELRMTLERAGVRFSVLDPSKLETDLTSLYLDVKRRQAL
jgi:uncharacterized protein (DUF58 family)